MVVNNYRRHQWTQILAWISAARKLNFFLNHLVYKITILVLAKVHILQFASPISWSTNLTAALFHGNIHHLKHRLMDMYHINCIFGAIFAY